MTCERLIEVAREHHCHAEAHELGVIVHVQYSTRDGRRGVDYVLVRSSRELAIALGY